MKTKYYKIRKEKITKKSYEPRNSILCMPEV